MSSNLQWAACLHPAIAASSKIVTNATKAANETTFVIRPINDIVEPISVVVVALGWLPMKQVQISSARPDLRLWKREPLATN